MLPQASHGPPATRRGRQSGERSPTTRTIARPRAAGGAPHAVAQARVGQQRVQRGGEVAAEARRIDRSNTCEAISTGTSSAGLAVDDHLRDAADATGDHGRPARHRLQVDDPERLVDRRAAEHGRVGVELAGSSRLHHLVDPDHPAARAWAAATASSISRAISGVSGAPAQRTTPTGSRWDRAHQVDDALLAGDAADEEDVRTVGSTP